MIREYACLQLFPGQKIELPRERLLYAITAHMDRQGLVACGRESALRTVRFAATPHGWAVYDDCADRMDMGALDGLGRCLTRKMGARAVGVVCSGEHLMLRLYRNGRLLDVFATSRRVFHRRLNLNAWISCRHHALRWRCCLPAGHTAAELASAFEQGVRRGRAAFSSLQPLLFPDPSAGFGFASLDGSALEGLITLYFCPGNVVRQNFLVRLLHPAPAKKPSAAGCSPESPKKP